MRLDRNVSNMEIARKKEWCEDLIDSQSNLQVGDCEETCGPHTWDPHARKMH
ncbi:hypothetical protein Sjap_015362 [Stephania japonica]|uniref:Uncharacterized protein n=1 Tax=Stephania japonica TaxID=461633 RepID=A0AAP0IJR5_9MAGN